MFINHDFIIILEYNLATIAGCHKRGLGAPKTRGGDCGKPLRANSKIRKSNK